MQLSAERLGRKRRSRSSDLAQVTSDWVWEVDPRGIYTFSSPNVEDLLGYRPEEIVGKTPFDFMPPDEAERVARHFFHSTSLRQPFFGLENVNTHRHGYAVVLETTGIPLLDADGELLGYRGIDRDITELKMLREALEQARSDLSQLAKVQSTERRHAKAILNKELSAHATTRQELAHSQSSLEQEQRRHRETKIALRTVLDQREKDKTALEQALLTNVHQLVKPYLKKLRTLGLAPEQHTCLSLLESRLDTLVSPFITTLTTAGPTITPAELRVADLIRDGKRTTLIAAMLGLSAKTVEDHRKSLRKKLGLTNKGTHLRSYLMSLKK